MARLMTLRCRRSPPMVAELRSAGAAVIQMDGDGGALSG